jgi:MFS family permease
MLPTAPAFAEAFRRYEIRLARLGGEPLVAMDAFKSPGLLRALGALTTLYALAAFFLTFSIWLQAGLGRSSLAAGIAILPLSVGFLIGSTFSPAIGQWAGRAAPSVGFLASASGLLALSMLVALAPAGQSPPFPLFATALLTIGLGMGSSVPTLFRVIVERVDPKRAGLVGGN